MGLVHRFPSRHFLCPWWLAACASRRHVAESVRPTCATRGPIGLRKRRMRISSSTRGPAARHRGGWATSSTSRLAAPRMPRSLGATLYSAVLRRRRQPVWVDLQELLADPLRIEIQPQVQVGFRGAGLQDPSGHWQIHGEHDEPRGVVVVDLLPHGDPLGSLGHDAQGGTLHVVDLLGRGEGGAQGVHPGKGQFEGAVVGCVGADQAGERCSRLVRIHATTFCRPGPLQVTLVGREVLA